MQNRPHDPEPGNREVAGDDAGREAPAPSGGYPAQGGTQHGVRRRAGDASLGGSATQTPRHATRYIETSHGRLSYRELAPLLAEWVARVEERVADDDYASEALDERLVLKLHGDIAAELVPAMGGKWRRKDVRVGSHEPPSYLRVPELIREYVLDLAARIENASDDYERLLETLAFAEGRLLSIHPFEDFNGRVTRVFLSELLRRLNLPEVDPTPDDGPPARIYLDALRAADRHNWKPLMSIWRERLDADDFFISAFETLTGYKPMPWQSRLFRTHFLSGDLPSAVSIPTGLGKTAVMAIWLIALAWQCRVSKLPALARRLVYVVDRRAVVDQSTTFAEMLRKNLGKAAAADLRAALGFADGQKLAISTLRGQFVDNREWMEDPSQPTIVVGTVDMIGSRLLFEGYGVSRKMRPYHAGLLGADALVLLDEAHLVPPFEALLATLTNEPQVYGPRSEEDRKRIPAFKLLPLSATNRSSGEDVFALEAQDYDDPENEGAERTRERLDAVKRLRVEQVAVKDLSKAIAERAWEISAQDASGVRCLIYCHERYDAQKVYDDLLASITKQIKPQITKGKGENAKSHAARVEVAARERIELFVGARRVFERQHAQERLKALGFLAGTETKLGPTTFLIATSAGEVGVDLDADHMVCDLVAWERMVQRLGRVNRRGGSDRGGSIAVFAEAEPEPGKSVKDALAKNVKDRSKKDHEAIKVHCRKVEALRAFRKPFGEALQASTDGAFDVGPGALHALAVSVATDDAIRNVLSTACTPAPLRPALTRPLADAWSMTSLEVHTGRPRIEPWLRGWVDDEPQTAMAWRQHLPVRTNASAGKKEIEGFFEAAPIQSVELLETETWRVLEWLMQRVAESRDRRGRPVSHEPAEDEDIADADAHPAGVAAEGPEPDEIGEAAPVSPDTSNSPSTVDVRRRNLKPDEVIGIVLSAGGDHLRTLRAGDIPAVPQKSKRHKEAKKRLEKEMFGATLVLRADLGGLESGLLKKEADATVPTADGGVSWGENGSGRPLIPFRIRASAEGDPPSGGDWQECLRFDLEHNADGEATRWLIVEEWPDSANTEDRRSSGPEQSLTEHQSWTERCARRIGERLGLDGEYLDMLAIAARLHDEGKKAERWQNAFRAKRNGRPYAKTKGPIDYKLLDGYRHEFGSLPYAQNDEAFQKLPPELQDLALHLIAAHHGFARPIIATAGCEGAPPSALEARAREVALRFARLQWRWGPWGLAWWEALLRAADQQASRENDAQGRRSNKEARR